MGSDARRLCLSMPATGNALQTVREDMRRWLRRAGVDDRAARDVVLALWEACANAVEHPVEPRSRDLVVKADIGAAGVRVSIRDTGRWRAPSRRVSRGLGLVMVRAVMDDVAIHRRPHGTEVTMVRSLSR
jgi:anti-sigma regulatory factor (Ser/Thr protein kinase)